MFRGFHMTDGSEQNDRTQTHVVLTKGTMVSHYRIVEKIGAGGMGEVYLAEDAKLKRRVAVKTRPANFAGNAVFKQRFDREAEAISRLNHGHIFTLYDIGHENRVDYRVIESLRERRS